jgi:hypothetical protein
MTDIREKHKISKVISEEAKAALEDRKDLSRPALLSEIASVVFHRRGEVTPAQLGTVASIVIGIAANDPATGIDGAPDLLNAWCAEASYMAFPDELAAALRSVGDDYGYVGNGKAREAFGVTDDEAVSIGLKLMISERLRGQIRRREQAIPIRAAVQTGKKEPWKDAGMSKNKFYNLRKVGFQLAVKEAVEAISPSQGLPEKWTPDLGMRRCMVLRKLQLLRERGCRLKRRRGLHIHSGRRLPSAFRLRKRTGNAIPQQERGLLRAGDVRCRRHRAGCRRTLLCFPGHR